MTYRRVLAVLVLGLTALTVVACGNSRKVTEEDTMTSEEQREARVGKLFGEDAFTFGPGARKDREEPGGGGVAVNGFLWRASLDTMSFMPLNSADPFGGVIITDWYIPPESPEERFKVQVYILDRQLRADGLRVTVFRQIRDSRGGWVDAGVKTETPAALENAILTRARQLRIESGSTL